MAQFKIQRGIEFLKTIINELSNPQILQLSDHPSLPHMWRRMLDIRFDSKKEPFEYRSKHFPYFMKSLYLKSANIPKEFKEFTNDGMIFDLVSDFVRQNVIAGTLEDALERPETHEREYLFFAFKFFVAMESAQIEELSLQRGVTVSAPAVLVQTEGGALEILTGSDLEEQKKNKKTRIVSWNPFGENNIDDMIEVCKKKGEMEVISHIQNDGFEVMDFEPTDSGLTKIVAEKKETGQKIEVRTDRFGALKTFIDTANPSERHDLQGKNWRDELAVLSARAGKNPDEIALRAEERQSVGEPASPLHHQKISTGILKVDGKALEGALGVKAGKTKIEAAPELEKTSRTERVKTPVLEIPKVALFAPFQKSARLDIPRGMSGIEEDVTEGQIGDMQGQGTRGSHRQRLTATGEVTGQRPNQPKREEKIKIKTPQKKQKDLADKAVVYSALASTAATLGMIGTSFIAT